MDLRHLWMVAVVLAAMGCAGLAFGQAETIEKIVVDGNVRISNQALMSQLALKEGDAYDEEALRKEFKITHEEAEKIKRGEETVGVSPDEAYHVIAESSGEICNEVSRALDYFRAASVQSYVKEVILSGGCALVGNFPRFLSDKLGIEVRLAEPFRNIKIPKKHEGSFENVAPIAAVAVGLAMRRPGDR